MIDRSELAWRATPVILPSGICVAMEENSRIMLSETYVCLGSPIFVCFVFVMIASLQHKVTASGTRVFAYRAN